LKEIGPVRRSNARVARRNSGVAKSGNRYVTNGKEWTPLEYEILRVNRDLSLDELMLLFPKRTRLAVQTKRVRLGLTPTKNRDWTKEEDDQLRAMCAAGKGWSEMSREMGVDLEAIRWRCLNKLLIRPNKPKVKVIGEPFADAIRQRAAQDGIGMRALDREIGTGTYFNSNCERRATRGLGPDMNAIAKAVEFFGGELTINWKDE
jgi:hypothetical protein